MARDWWGDSLVQRQRQLQAKEAELSAREVKIQQKESMLARKERQLMVQYENMEKQLVASYNEMERRLAATYAQKWVYLLCNLSYKILIIFDRMASLQPTPTVSNNTTEG